MAATDAQIKEGHIRATGMNMKKYKKIRGFVDRIVEADPKPSVDKLLEDFAAKCYANFPKAEGVKQAKKFLNVLYLDLDNLIQVGSEKALMNAAKSQKGPAKMRIVRLNKPIDGFTKKLDKYLVGETIGKGATSKVKLGRGEDGREVAIKILTVDGSNFDMEELKKEIDVLKKLDHKNVIRLYDCFDNVQYPNAGGKDGTTTVMVLELATKGELFDFFMHTGNFEAKLARWFFHQMADGIEYCHSMNVAHRDLKPENVLMGDGFMVKLVDFGFATGFGGPGGKNLMQTALGTPGYAAPEILARQKYTASVDIFSLGVITFICIAGFPPFQEAKKSDWWFDKIMKKKDALFWKAHERTFKFDDDAKAFLLGMLREKPSDRMDWKAIRAHKWFKGAKYNQEEAMAHLMKRKKEVDIKKFNDNKDKLVPAVEERDIVGLDPSVRPPKASACVNEANKFYSTWSAADIYNRVEDFVLKTLKGHVSLVETDIWVGSENGYEEAVKLKEKKKDEQKEEEIVRDKEHEGPKKDGLKKGFWWNDMRVEVGTETKKANAPEATSDDLPPEQQKDYLVGVCHVRDTGDTVREKNAEGKEVDKPLHVVYINRERGRKNNVGQAIMWAKTLKKIMDGVGYLMANPETKHQRAQQVTPKQKDIEAPKASAAVNACAVVSKALCGTGKAD